MERVLGPRGFNNVKGDLMRVRSKAILASTAIIAAVALSACGQYGNLQARKAFKDANGLYQAQNYREAATKYEEAITASPDSPEASNGVLLPREQLRQPLQTGAQRRGRERQEPHRRRSKITRFLPSARRGPTSRSSRCSISSMPTVPTSSMIRRRPSLSCSG